MNNYPKLMSCLKCGKVWVVEQTEEHELWHIISFNKEWYMEAQPIDVEQLQVLIQTGEVEAKWAGVYKNRGYMVAASNPICPDELCGSDLEDTYYLGVWN